MTSPAVVVRSPFEASLRTHDLLVTLTPLAIANGATNCDHLPVEPVPRLMTVERDASKAVDATTCLGTPDPGPGPSLFPLSVMLPPSPSLASARERRSVTCSARYKSFLESASPAAKRKHSVSLSDSLVTSPPSIPALALAPVSAGADMEKLTIGAHALPSPCSPPAPSRSKRKLATPSCASAVADDSDALPSVSPQVITPSNKRPRTPRIHPSAGPLSSPRLRRVSSAESDFILPFAMPASMWLFVLCLPFPLIISRLRFSLFFFFFWFSSSLFVCCAEHNTSLLITHPLSGGDGEIKHTAFNSEAWAGTRNALAEDAGEGSRAFIEGRPPQWTGR